ncbi:MAG: outer membrane protein OmpK [Ferrimonas sp.]
MVRNIKYTCKHLLAFFIWSLMFVVPASAEYMYGFADVNINWLDWSKRTERNSDGFKEDFYYLELEGGAGFDWGELYMFFDSENTFNGNDTRGSNSNTFKGNNSFRIASKIAVGYNLKYNLQAYAQNYYVMGSGFYDSMTVMGLRYNFFTDTGFWAKPFLGINYTRNDTWSGINGGTLGWVFGYDFIAWEQPFSLSNWNEMEFGRSNDYSGSGPNRRSFGLNGALALWWHLPQSPLTVGVQYRYFENKLAQDGYGEGVIYTIKYNF